jgi:AcrR family transcriptional regulator
VDPKERGERTRLLLLDIARERFARDGYRGTSVAVIAREAGVGGTTAFVHFDSKEDLFLTAVDDDLASMFDEIAGLLWDPSAQGLVADRVTDSVLEVVERHPLARRLLAGLEPAFTIRVLESGSFAALRSALATLFEQDQREGRVRSDVDATELADGVVALMLGVAMASVQIGPTISETFGPGIAAVLRCVQIER